MEELRQIVLTLAGSRQRKTDTLNEILEKKNKPYYKLYKGIADNSIRTDEEAARQVFGVSSQSSRYKMAKKRFAERMYTAMLYTMPNEKQSASFNKSLYFCYKHFVVARLLAITTPTKIASKMLEKVLRKANEYELFEIAELCTVHLRRENMLTGNSRNFEYYDRLFHDNHEKLLAEATAEKLYNDITIKIAKTYAPQPGLATLAKEAATRIDKLRKKYDTNNLKYYSFAASLVYYELVNDYTAALQVCSAFEAYFLSSKFYAPTRYANALARKVDCYLHLQDYEKGIACATQAFGLYKKGKGNWWVLQELSFLLALNKEDLGKASELYAESLVTKGFEVLREKPHELWHLYGGYLWFSLQYNRQHELAQKYFNKGYKLSKSLNEMEETQKDKKGINIAVRILQVLIPLQAGDFYTVIDRFEALRWYAYKYLKQSEAVRSFAFIRLLMLLIESDFEPEKLGKETQDIFRRMQTVKVSFNSSQTRMEVIPYERIWDMMMDMLGQKPAVITSSHD